MLRCWADLLSLVPLATEIDEKIILKHLGESFSY